MSSIDLVAVNGQRVIIGARQFGDAVLNQQTVPAGQSWSDTVKPVAADCAVRASADNLPTLPDGDYEFAATAMTDSGYLSSNLVTIRISQGEFSNVTN